MLRACTDDVVVKHGQHRSSALGGRQEDHEVSESKGEQYSDSQKSQLFFRSDKALEGKKEGGPGPCVLLQSSLATWVLWRSSHERSILRQEGLTAAHCAGTTTDTSPARTSSSSLKLQSCGCLVGVTSSSLMRMAWSFHLCMHKLGSHLGKARSTFLPFWRGWHPYFLHVSTNPGKGGSQVTVLKGA